MASEDSKFKKGDKANWLLNLDKIEDSTRRNYFSGLPSEHQLLDFFTNAFVLNKPKGRVGGDAYWLHFREDEVYLALFTCVGEGHLAHMMIRIYMNVLNQVAESESLSDTGDLLKQVNAGIKVHFANKNNILLNTNANMGLIRFNMTTKAMEFAGANMNLVQIARDGERLIEGEKNQVGDARKDNATFKSVKISDIETSSFYLSSTRIFNLIGGPNFKKLPVDDWMKFLKGIQRAPVTGHKESIEEYLEDWTGSGRQNDDILVIGFTA